MSSASTSSTHTTDFPSAALLAAQRFAGKVVIVTGAGSGIGAATARRFSQEGAMVAIADLSDDKLAATRGDLPEDRTLAHPADVSQWEAVQALIEATVERFGRIDVMVNNAGIAVQGKATEASLEDWHRVLATNVSGVFHGARAALPHLVRSRGCIVNTSSVSGLGGDWDMSFYNTSKGAVSNLTRALALDHGKDGVRVNAVAPGLLFQSGPQTAENFAAASHANLLRHPIDPAQVAQAAAFLAGNPCITGMSLCVDNGQHLVPTERDIMFVAERVLQGAASAAGGGRP